MERVGVAAVVEGLSGFLGDMGKMDDSIRKLVSPTNILGSVFGGLGNIISNLVGGVFRTLEYALGTLIANAVTYLVDQIKELIANTIEAGKEFQTLELRLNTLNFNALVESGVDMNTATEESIRLTKEQMGWLQKLAATTPYDNTDISNVYTLARGYSFTDKEARNLTETITDFTSGMGLGNTEIVRIIKNFGQMRQLGKVTQRDLNDLATGAFVPVNEILGKMRVETGLTGDAFDDFRNSGDGVEMFLRTFTSLVEGKFGGSAQKMAKTFGAATDNLKDFVKSVVGLNIVKPILDVLGSRLAGFMDELTSEGRWDQIVGIATRIGVSLTDMLGDILALAPDAKGVADAVVSALEGIADWIDQHANDIVEFVQESARWIREDLVPAIQQAWDFLFGKDMQPGAIQKFGAWLKEEFLPFIKTQVIPGISDLFDAITGKKKQTPTTTSGDKQGEGEQDTTALQNVVAGVASLATALPSVLDLLGAIGSAILLAFGSTETQTFSEFVTNTLIPSIQGLTQFVMENQAAFALLFKAIIALEVIGFIVGLVGSLIISLVSLGVSILAFATFTPIILGVKRTIEIFVAYFTSVGTVIAAVIWFLFSQFMNFKTAITKMFDDVMAAIRNKDWRAAGKAIVDGLMAGIRGTWANLLTLVRTLATNALNTFNSIFQIQSPSKVMADIGANIVAGLAKGVKDSTGSAVKAMAGSANAVLAAATPQMSYSMATTAPSQNTYQTTNNMNLNVNSQSRVEPLIQDFNMMKSLVGG